MPKLFSERKISVFFQPPDVTLKELQHVKNYYNSAIPLINIIRKLQGPRARNGQTPLAYVDIYSILYCMRDKGEIQQRRLPAQEMSIDDFARFFTTWKKGGTLDQCIHVLKDFRDRRFATAVFRTLGNRFRNEKIKKLEAHGISGKGHKAPDDLHGNIAFKTKEHVLDLGHRTKIGNEECIVIFLSDIPVSWIKRVAFLPELCLHINGFVEIGQQIENLVDARQKMKRLELTTTIPELADQQRAIEMRHATPADQQQQITDADLLKGPPSPGSELERIQAEELDQLDPGNMLTEHARQQQAIKGQYGKELKERIQNDKSMLEGLNRTGHTLSEEELAEIEAETFRPIADGPSSEQEGLDLANLLDDDDFLNSSLDQTIDPTASPLDRGPIDTSYNDEAVDPAEEPIEPTNPTIN